MVHFEIKDLSFYYPTEKKKPALSHINLKIERGQYVTVCGKSGSGKTTLLRHLKSVLAPHGKTEGEIFFEGKPLKDANLRTQSSRIGYVMQNPDNQIVTDKVWHELAFGLENLGVPGEQIRRRTAEIAQYFGMESWFRRPVSELSGGQKQLLNLASVVIMQPDVLLLDEPTRGIDVGAKYEIYQLIIDLANRGKVVIVVSSEMPELLGICDRIMVMSGGRLAGEIDAEEAT